MTAVVSQLFQVRQLFIAGAIVCIGILNSCESKYQAPVSPYANDLGIKPATIAQIDTPHYTTIEWIDRVKDFGTIRYGDSVLLTFRFKNTGIHPLFLSAVKPSCGCTVPHYPAEAIMPGEESELTANFHSVGQADTVHKTILVTSNTSNGVTHLLTIEGRVDNRRDKEGTK
jgi:hypothetical protein